tara:strand:- start:23163 stop:23936 length:774 start_codon:yes stop_codon:yes gene_type:complete
MTKQFKVLISNDDGVYAPGIACLAREMQKIAKVEVVAPDRNRSGASHSLTLTRPLRTHEAQINDYPEKFISVEGTPTDCVHLAITGLMDDMPDIVVSGINDGANMGDDVLYSGTVAAAMEGRFLGFPAVAISLVGNKNYETAAIIAKNIVQRLRKEPLAGATILNVNVPDVHYKEITGYEVTRLGTRHCAEPTIKDKDPRGATIYWVGPVGKEDDAGPGTDFHAIKHNKVSITPLHVDLTSYESFDRVAHWVGDLTV